jgi:hypothetical protein
MSEEVEVERDKVQEAKDIHIRYVTRGSGARSRLATAMQTFFHANKELVEVLRMVGRAELPQRTREEINRVLDTYTGLHCECSNGWEIGRGPDGEREERQCPECNERRTR